MTVPEASTKVSDDTVWYALRSLDHHARPVPADVDENVVGLRLPVQARAARAERGVPPGTDAVLQDRAHVVDGAGPDNDLRKVPVGAGIGGVADQVGDPVQHLVLADQLDQVVLEGVRGAFGASEINGIVPGRALGPADRPRAGREQLHVKALMPVMERPTMRVCMVSVPSKVWMASRSTMCRMTW